MRFKMTPQSYTGAKHRILCDSIAMRFDGDTLVLEFSQGSVLVASLCAEGMKKNFVDGDGTFTLTDCEFSVPWELTT